MKKQAINREFNFADAELYAECVERIKYVRRDIKEFRTYAYGDEEINAFEALCKKFTAFPTDDELVGEQMEATNKKYEAREVLKTAIRSIMTRVASKYKLRSGQYRRFGTLKMNDMSDPKLFICGLRVVRVSEKMLDHLFVTGLRQEHIDRVRRAVKDFENCIHLQQDKISDRDIQVEKRTILGNEIYREMSRICDIGKDIWADKNRLKYENYTIYESNNEQKKARKQRKQEEAEAEKENQ